MSAWDEIQYGFNDRLLGYLSVIPGSVRDRVQEIRMRLEQPLCLTVDSVTWFCGVGGLSYSLNSCTGMNISQSDLDDTLSRYCDGALYSREDQIKQGYISLRGGHRAGLCGYFQRDNGYLYHLSSINIRLARGIPGCADELRKRLGEKPVSALIIGPPGSGKTTILRDLARGYSYQGVRVGVADERGELSADGGFDLGPCTDVITSMEKEDALMCLLRFMNPLLLVFDELGDHAQAVNAALTAGVKIITSIHADSIDQAKTRLKCLGISHECFDVLVLLSSSHTSIIREMEWLHGLDAVGGRSSYLMDTARDRLCAVQKHAE